MAISQLIPQLDRRRDFEKAARHTRLVRRLRWLLPVASVLIALIFVGVSYVRSLLNTIDPGTIQLDGSSLVLQKPKIAGYDKQKRPYEVTANTAKQSIMNPREIEMEGLHADIGKGLATVVSDYGTFNSDSEHARLRGNIRANSSQGHEVRLEEADIDMKSGSLVSSKPVTITQGANIISADRLEVGSGGSVIRFVGNVRVELNSTPVLEPAP